MREHMGLFRGKRIDTGGWVEGVYMPAVDNNPPYIFRSPKYTMGYEVDPTTIGECTGLKDKNGKLIFEGNVVLYPWKDEDNPERFVIKFKDGCFVASPVKETEDYWDFMVGRYSEKMEIIGNIHDNPELLKGGEQ